MQVLNEDLDEDTLKEVLRECLRDAPEGDDKARNSRAASLLARCFRGGNGAVKDVGDVDSEVMQAAHYIIERFGAVPKPGEGEHEEEEFVPVRRAGRGRVGWGEEGRPGCQRGLADSCGVGRPGGPCRPLQRAAAAPAATCPGCLPRVGGCFMRTQTHTGMHARTVRQAACATYHIWCFVRTSAPLSCPLLAPRL